MLRKIAIVLIAILVVFLGVLYFISPDETTVERLHIAEPTTSRITTEGEYVGFIDEWGTRAWLGIPYALPPIGEHRWRAPKPPSTFSGIKTALESGSPCIQLPNVMVRGGADADSGVVGSEDCLYLNIWSPPNSINAPVMFWIHGGGNSTGEAVTYNGATLAAKEQVVVVAINYRLGLMGWFNHPAVLAGNQQQSGNFGILDVVRALEWVHENIRSFGGDPDNVTVFGESAGGFNTLAMLTTPSSKDLFHRAIVQSGSFSRTDPKSGYSYVEDGGHTHSALEVTAKMLLSDDLAATKEEAKNLVADWSDQQLHQYLMSKQPAELYATFENPGFGGMVDFPAAFADNVVLPSGSPEEVFLNQSNFHQVPVILGTNRDEPAIFMFQSPEYTENFLGFLPRLKDADEYRRVVHYLSQAWRVRGVDSIATAMKRAGHDDVFAYQFDWDEEPSLMGFDLSTALGAAHLLEVPFVFGNFEMIEILATVYPNDEAQTQLSDSMMSYWAEFAQHGNPGKGGKEEGVQWSAYGANENHTIVFDTEQDGGIRMSTALVTYEKIKQEFQEDKAFNDKDTRCKTYVRTLGDTPIFSESDYESLGCSHLPWQEIGWN